MRGERNVMSLSLNIGIFLVFQAVAAVFFKWGSLSPEKFWYGFVFGNVFGATSIIMMINAYKVLHPAAALAICTGGAFILNQLALLAVYRQSISFGGWFGIALIFAGIALFAFTAQPVQ